MFFSVLRNVPRNDKPFHNLSESLIPIKQPKQQTEDQVTDNILEKRGPGGESGQFPTLRQGVIFIDKWSHPPRREQKHFAKNGPFEPVWARQETFEDRSIKFGQDDTIEEMNNPGEEGKPTWSLRFSIDEALDEAHITVTIACEIDITFPYQAV